MTKTSKTQPTTIVRFRQKFVSGICAGLQYDGTIGFPNEVMAHDWVAAMVGVTVRPGPFSGSSAYKVIAAEIQWGDPC